MDRLRDMNRNKLHLKDHYRDIVRVGATGAAALIKFGPRVHATVIF